MLVKKNSSSFSNPVLWAAFIVYLLTVGYAIMHHEMWGDELHSWNIAKASGSFADLIHNSRFEGHPPLWYTILWTISKFTHHLGWMQGAQFFLAGSVAFVIIFYSPFPLITRILIPFGYFFLYEYAVLSRNYAAGVLMAFLICLILHKEFRGKNFIYYLLLLLMSNVHLFSLVLAGSLHLYFLLLKWEREKRLSLVVSHVISGAIVFLPALYFIYPPSDSGLNMGFWLDKWNTDNIKALGQAPLRSMLPVPAWWNYQFWNTQFLIQLKGIVSQVRYVNSLVSLSLIAFPFWVMRKNRKSLVLFGANLIITLIVALIIFPITSARYSGFIFICFLAAYWLHFIESPVNSKSQRWVKGLLIIHAIAGLFSVYKDIKYPFSNLYRVNEILKKVPANGMVVTDYWALNAMSAYGDKAWYCIDMQQKMSFVMWGTDLARIQKKPHRYYDGLHALFEKTGVKDIYMVSMSGPEVINKVDDIWFTSYSTSVIDRIEDVPIEKGSNLFLYDIHLK